VSAGSPLAALGPRGGRGYPPSTVPEEPAAYSEEHLVADLLGLLDALGIERAHVAGLSMGGAVALKFAIAHPERCLGVVVAGAGGGAEERATWRRDMLMTARTFEEQGTEAVAAFYTRGPARVPFQRKDPRGWQEFHDRFRRHSARGSALTMRGVQLARRTVYEVEDDLRRLRLPVLIVVGDEDEPCLGPALFNRTVLDFLTAVEQGRWTARDEVSASLLPPDVRPPSA
jgi:pimeloyl-ACP methyl ester carboxylesterase